MLKEELAALMHKSVFDRSFLMLIRQISEPKTLISLQRMRTEMNRDFDNKMKGTKTEGDRTYDSDIVIYRLAEMYLFKAEAYAALNQTPQAIIELNRVRDRAKIGTYSGSTIK